MKRSLEIQLRERAHMHEDFTFTPSTVQKRKKGGEWVILKSGDFLVARIPVNGAP